MFTVPGFMAPRKPVVDQGVQAVVGHSIDVAATATVAAIGAAKFLVLLVPERDAAAAAIARGDVDLGFVNKFHGV